MHRTLRNESTSDWGFEVVFKKTVVNVLVRSVGGKDRFRIEVPGHSFVLPDTHLSLVVHRPIHINDKRGPHLGYGWQVTEPVSGLFVSAGESGGMEVREWAIQKAMEKIESSGMDLLASQIMRHVATHGDVPVRYKIRGTLRRNHFLNVVVYRE